MLQRSLWVLTAALLVACGGSANSDLTGSSSGGSHTDASAGGAGSGGSSASGGASGSGGSIAAGSGGANGGAGGSVAGGAGGSAGSGGAAGAPGAGSVKCGLDTCSVASQSCCFGDNVKPYCYKKDQLAGCRCTGLLCQKAVVDCDGPEDCPGAVCCATKGITGTHFSRLSCTKLCQNGIGVTVAVVCHLNTSGQCPGGMTCVTDNRLPGGYGLCK